MKLCYAILVHVADCLEHVHIPLISFLFPHKIPKIQILFFWIFIDLGFNFRGLGSIRFNWYQSN